ncbi:MAG: alanine dehydrogenase, partial [Agromyces sp.]
MHIGVPAEVKNNEFRVAITPAGVDAFVKRGHAVSVQSGAGVGAGYSDEAYRHAGATIVDDAATAWAAEMVLKVKEPISSEYGYLRPDLTLFTYLHLAADRPLTDALLAAGTTAIAYETVQLPDRSLPLLTPMSEVAGRLAPLVGANHMLAANGGIGVLMAGVPGTRRAKVVVIVGGVAGEQAAVAAAGMGADVTVFDVSLPRLRQLDALYGGSIRTLASSPYEVAHQLKDADLVVGAVLIPGAAAPKVVTDEMVKGMKPGSVLVDIAIDQGGCFEGSHATTHADPTFKVHNSIFYCVANMPGAVPGTSTPALTNATLPYALAIADKGWEKALSDDA